MERKNAITIKGAPLTLMGEELRVGVKAPDAELTGHNMKLVKLSDLPGKIRVICAVPSLDTPVCDLQIKRFNDEASALSSDIKIIFVSMDLPFAQKRFCSEFDIKKVLTLSDHRTGDLGLKYGVLIKELRLLARAVFVMDREGTVKYVEYVKDLAEQPDYKAVLETIKNIIE